LLVEDDDIRRAVALMMERTRTLVEPAGAAPLAAAMRLRERLRGRRLGLICSGGNISPEQLRAVLAAPEPGAATATGA
jgi:threonine dehydratase